MLCVRLLSSEVGVWVFGWWLIAELPAGFAVPGRSLGASARLGVAGGGRPGGPIGIGHCRMVLTTL